MSYRSCALLLLVGVYGTARAESGDPLTDTFRLNVGAFFVGSATDVTANGSTKRGTPVDLEHDFGLKDTTRWRIDAYWRFAKRHRFRIMYFNTDRTKSATIDHTIEFENTLYPVSANVEATLSTHVWEAAYQYDFARGDTYSVGASLGVHNLEFNLGLTAVGGAILAGQSASQSASANGPLPVVGLNGVWRFNKYFYMDGQAQYFKIKINPYDGTLANYSLAFVWQPLKWFGIGAGYDYFTTHVNVDATHFNGSLAFRYSGARVFLTGSF